MSIRVEFEGWVNEVRQFDWGTVYNVSHSQRQKNHQGEWETTGYDYLDVTSSETFAKNDRVKIVGTLKTKRFDKKDGSKGIALQVRAETMVPVEKGPAKQATVSDMQDVWPALKQVPADTPF
jgi:single-stranded DNA-binding protein